MPSQTFFQKIFFLSRHPDLVIYQWADSLSIVCKFQIKETKTTYFKKKSKRITGKLQIIEILKC